MMPDTPQKMTLAEHLEELRARVIAVLIAVSAAAVIGYFFSEGILEFLARPAERYIGALYFFEPQAAFLVRLKIAVFAGFFIASPVWFYQTWMFAAPALGDKEKKMALPVVLISSVLFLVGAFFAHAFMLPFTLGFLMSYQTPVLSPLINVERYLGFAMQLLIALGIVFDLPVFVLGLVKLGVLNAAMLRRHRKIVVVGIFIIAAVLTPPDVISQLLMAAPMLILYEVSIWIAVWAEKRAGSAQKLS